MNRIGGVVVVLCLFLAVVALNQAYKRATVTPGSYLRPVYEDIIELAAIANAQSDPALERILKKARATGEVDVQELTKILEKRAKTAGDLQNLRDKLATLSAGRPPVPAQTKPTEIVQYVPPAPQPAKTAPAPSRPQRQTEATVPRPARVDGTYNARYVSRNGGPYVEPKPAQEADLYPASNGPLSNQTPGQTFQRSFGLGSGNWSLTNQQRLGVPNSRGFAVSVLGRQLRWKSYTDPAPRTPAYQLNVAGKIGAAHQAPVSLEGATLMVPTAPRYALVYRSCDGTTCSEPQAVTDTKTVVCNVGAIPEFWYNDYVAMADGTPLDPMLSYGNNNGEYAVGVLAVNDASACRP